MTLKTITEHFKFINKEGSDFEKIIQAFASAGKTISKEINRSGISTNSILGSSGTTNSSGEDVQSLDLFANQIVKDHLISSGLFCCLGSEEENDVVLTNTYDTSDYVALFDPLDGSSNIDVNVSVGTIFSIFKKKDFVTAPIDHCFQKGSQQILAGYILYGPATTLIYTTGESVHEFTFDIASDQFIMTKENIRIPSTAKYYSLNDALYNKSGFEIQKYVDCLRDNKLSSRYVGSLVADFHRNLLKGGIYLYPSTLSAPNGKLRLLYEANPLGMIAKAAGGDATNGEQNILEIVPNEIHQRVPLIVGSSELLSLLESVKKDLSVQIIN